MVWRSMSDEPPVGERVWLAYETGTELFQWNMVPCYYTNGGNDYCEPGWYTSPSGGLGTPIKFKPIAWMRFEPPTPEVVRDAVLTEMQRYDSDRGRL